MKLLSEKTCSKCDKKKELSEFYFRGGKHRNECKSCEKLRQKEYYKKNKEIHTKRIRKWDKQNKDKRNRYNRIRRKTVAGKIKSCLSSRIRSALKNKDLIRSKKTLELLGCDLEFFRKHFKSLFTCGMTWKKYLAGEIHIDHIKPCASFDLTDLDQQNECFHYSNLQPLWGIDNLKKGSKIV